MSGEIIIENNESWRCDEDGCGTVNSPEDAYCSKCGKKKDALRWKKYEKGG